MTAPERLNGRTAWASRSTTWGTDSSELAGEIIVTEATEDDVSAIAQVSMDAFYGRPWPMAPTSPWVGKIAVVSQPPARCARTGGSCAQPGMRLSETGVRHAAVCMIKGCQAFGITDRCASAKRDALAATKAAGLEGVIETCLTLLSSYKSPTGASYSGIEYAWSRSQVVTHVTCCAVRGICSGMREQTLG